MGNPWRSGDFITRMRQTQTPAAQTPRGLVHENLFGCAGRTKCTGCERILRTADFEVEMGTGRPSGRTHVADDFARGNPLSDPNDIAAHMRIEGLDAITMIDNDVASVSAVPS